MVVGKQVSDDLGENALYSGDDLVDRACDLRYVFSELRHEFAGNAIIGIPLERFAEMIDGEILQTGLEVHESEAGVMVGVVELHLHSFFTSVPRLMELRIEHRKTKTVIALMVGIVRIVLDGVFK